MVTAHQIRGLITQTTSGKARLRALREVGYEVCCYATRCCRHGAPCALIAREAASKCASCIFGEAR